MWSFGIKGFLAFLFLCSIANSQKILDPEDEYYPIEGSIYDRLMKSSATKDEKESVIRSLKLIVVNVPDSANWTHLADVIRKRKLEENIEDLGGEKSKTAVTLLQQSLEGSGSVSEVTSFLDTCLELVSMENVTRTEKTLILTDFLAPSKYSTWNKFNPILLDVMGMRKVFVFPQKQIDHLVKYWNDTPVLNNSILIDQLEKLSNIMQQEGRELFMVNLVQFLQSFENSKDSPKIQNWTEVDSSILFNGVDEVFKDLLDPRLLDFDFKMIETIENNFTEHPDFETVLMSQMENDQVKDYFTRINKTDRVHTFVTYTAIFIPIVKNYTNTQLEAISKLFKEYTSFKNSNKLSFGNVLSTNATRYECWDMWKSQKVSTEIEKMVKLVKLFKKEFDIETCLSKIIDIRDTVKLSKYWNQHPELEKLPTFLKNLPTYLLLYIQLEYKEILKMMLTDTKDLTRKSTQHLLKTLRLNIHDNPKFVEFFETIKQLHDIDLEPVWMMIKQFLEFSDENRKKYIEINFEEASLKSLGDFFKTIQRVSNVAREFEEHFLEPNEQWNKEQMEKLLELLKVLKYRYEKDIDRALNDNLPYKDCLKIVKANVELFEKLNNMATSFELNTFSLSCERLLGPGKK